MELFEGVSAKALKEARRLVRYADELIAEEKHWCQGAFARDRKGQPVLPGSKRPKPFAWCLAGAIVEAEMALHGTQWEGAKLIPKSALEVAHRDLALRCLIALDAVGFWCVRFTHGLEKSTKPRVHDESRDKPSSDLPRPPIRRGLFGQVVAPINDLPAMTHPIAVEQLKLADALLAVCLERLATTKRQQRKKH